MQIKTTLQILGAKCFKGDVEGKHYDSTTVFAVMDVSERNGNAVGKNAVEMKYGTSQAFEPLKDLVYPINAEVELLLTNKGYELKSLRPLPGAKA